MGCGCGSNNKRNIRKKVSNASKRSLNTNSKKPVNSLKKDAKRKSRAVKIRAINKTLSKK